MASQMENAATEQLAPATSETHESSVPSPSSTDESPDASLATSSPEESDQASTTVRLYLSGLGRQTTKATLESFFAKYSPKDIVVKDRGDEISFKFAFLSVDAASAQTIMDESPHDIDGSTCRVERTRVALRSGRARDKQGATAKATPDTDNNANTIRKLFLGGLAASTTSDDLRVRPPPISAPLPGCASSFASTLSPLPCPPSSSSLAPRLLQRTPPPTRFCRPAPPTMGTPECTNIGALNFYHPCRAPVFSSLASARQLSLSCRSDLPPPPPAPSSAPFSLLHPCASLLPCRSHRPISAPSTVRWSMPA